MAQIIVGKESRIQEFPFADEVHDMGDFVEKHPQILGPDIVIVSRELQVGTTDGSRRIDFLVYDTELNQIGIVEMKNQTADEKVLLQTLRYANWIRNNPDTVRYQIKKKNLDINEEEIDPDRVKVLILAPKVSQSLAELCQYITAFDFEFIKVQRFKDDKGEVYAVTDILEVDLAEPTPSKGKGIYDIEWYQSQGVRPKQIDELINAIQQLETICQDQGWELNTRYVKWSVRFQTVGGRNAFFISVRKTQSHYLRLCLGPDFDTKILKANAEILIELKHTKKTSRWWSLPLDMNQLDEYAQILKLAYENIL